MVQIDLIYDFIIIWSRCLEKIESIILTTMHLRPIVLGKLKNIHRAHLLSV